MKQVAYIFIAIVTMIISSCGGSSYKSDVQAEFWETNNDFDAPMDWKTYTYADAFSIKIPDYMKENIYDTIIDEEKLKNGDEDCMSAQMNTLSESALDPGQTAGMSFSARHDCVHNSYARIYIRYIKANGGDFLDHLDRPNLDREDSKAFCNMLIKEQLGSGTLVKIRRREMFMTNKCNMALDLCYQRVGNTEDEGPVTVHIYYLQHTDEAVLMTVSYHDKNKEQYKDLFNIVQTLEWKNIKSRRTANNM